MTQAKRIYTCDCGHQWQEGQLGSHDCAAGYKMQRDALYHAAMHFIRNCQSPLARTALDDLRKCTHTISPLIHADAVAPQYTAPSMVRGHAIEPRQSWGAGDRRAEERAQVEDMIMRGISAPKRRAQLLEDMGE